MNVRRTDQSVFAQWWWTVDHLLLAAVFGLAFAGLILTLAASPHVAVRLGQPEYHFVVRQLAFFGPALILMLSVSLLDPRSIRRLCLALFAISLLLMAGTLLFAEPVKGATRWFNLGPIAIQPSEIAKPAFVVLAAWFFSVGGRRRDEPGNLIAFLLFAAFATLLILQPDFGQTMLVVLVWGALFFLAGMPWIWSIGIGLVAMSGIGLAYALVPHVTARFDQFLDPESGDTFQVDTAREAILNGGWLGQGPGEGTVKRILPDAHTDFIFAVAAEEFGIIACLVLVALFALIVLRVLSRALNQHDPFTRLALSGLAVLIGVQSGINMAVNLGLAPAKGMTLPFISYGGSSLISVALALGFILGLSRRRPGGAGGFRRGAVGVAA